MTELRRYGDHPDQVVELQAPETAPHGLAVLVHGGYWRVTHDRSLMVPLAGDLVSRGWAVANVEYRRGPDSLPAMLDDTREAVLTAARAGLQRGWGGPVVLVGHSVGGQLALLTADLVDTVVALAPVTDLVRTRAEGLGDDAVREFITQSPQEAPERYAEGSPATQLPVGRPVLAVHGSADTRVPLAHSEDFVERARQAGDRVELWVLDGVDHLAMIDPAQPWWPRVVDWMASSARSR